MSSSPDPTPTPDDIRAASRERWERSAAQWEALRDWTSEAFAPVSHAIVDGISPQPGHVILEAAAGLGDPGLLAAELVHPGGKVIISDGAEAMVAAAARRATERGIENVETTPMELEWLDMPAASVDGLLVQFGYMLVPDPETALRDARRVLRPGGRIGFAVWDAADRNPWLNVGMSIAAQRGLLDEWPLPDTTPNPFALSDHEKLIELVAGAGFILPELQVVELHFRSPSAQVARERLLTLADQARRAIEAVPAKERQAIEHEIETALTAYPDPSRGPEAIALPGSALVVTADA